MSPNRPPGDRSRASPPRPRLGLALGGGGALGWAHIGALQVLQEQGVTFDSVAGTSIGALVGAAFVAGKLDVLEAAARQMDWKRLMRLADLQLHGRGLIGGEAVMREFERHLGRLTFDTLPCPFATVAVDLVTGEEVVWTQGSVTEAVRASISIPGLFTPVSDGDRVLVDGGIVDPLPVAPVRGLGAERVIAVDVLSDYEGRLAAAPAFGGPLGRIARQVFRQDRNGEGQSEPKMLAVTTASFALMMRTLTLAKMATAPPDVHIVPRVRHILAVEFDRAEELIACGRAAALEAMDDIRRLLETKAPAVGAP